MDKDKELIKELRAVLEKYDASIGFTVSECSDTYGLSNERMYIDMQDVKQRYRYRRILEVDGWTLSDTDLSTENMV